jgi:hypothetical protein
MMHPPSLHTLRVDAIAPTPWKNGGGTTRDLVVWPPDAQWNLRISVAEIARDGPFSDYSGIDRWFVVLQGRGVALQLGDQRREQSVGAPPLHFDGALAPMCWLLGGPTRDLNVMVRQGAGLGSMALAQDGEDWLSPTQWRALYTTHPLKLQIDGADAAEPTGSALLWSPHAANQRWRIAEPLPEGALAYWIAFQAHESDRR